MKRIVLLLCFLLISIGLFYGHDINTFRLDHISVSDGLPNSSVSGILQDDRGYMWIGTQAGLTRYDGYSFKTFLNDPFDSNSLPHNLIQTMYMDKDDILWLGTYNGLSRLDLKSETFTNYISDDEDPTSLSYNVVAAIERDEQGRLWVGTLKGLNLLDEENGTFRHFENTPDDPFSLPENTIRAIKNDNKGNLWIGTYGGLSLWDDEEELFINYAPVKNDETSIPSVYVMDIQLSPHSDDEILLGSWAGGVSVFNSVKKTAAAYETENMNVYKLLVDQDDLVWAGTWGGGLSIIDLETGAMDHFSKERSDELSHDIVYSLHQDFSGVIWIGTNGGGINKYVDWKNQYKFYINNPDDPYSLPSGKVIAAHEDFQNNIWFSVDGKGVSRLNPETGLFRNYSYDENNDRSLSNDSVNDVFEDSKGNLWIGTNDGLNRYNRESDDFHRIYTSQKEYSLPDNLIYSITEDHSGNLWLGSYTRGIFVRSAETGEYRSYEYDKEDFSSISDNLIRSLYVDSLGIVWICTNKGLNRYNLENDNFIRYMHDFDDRSSISSNDVRNIFEDSDGDLWVATNGGGVNLFDRDTETFSLITTEDGLLSNSVLGIDEDVRGRLLFITMSGISVYNKLEKSFNIIDEKTGLLSSELTSGYLKASDDSLYIGGIGGITYIPMIEEQQINYTPTININEFSVLGIPYKEGGESVWALENAVLNYNENTLSFEFALSDYASEGQNQFAYKLEGEDSEWVYSGIRNFARYTNLDPGAYTFKVIGADSRNNWNLIGTSLDILIKPPFWRTTFAFISYFILFILMFLLLIFRIKRKQDESLRKIEEQKILNVELENRVRKRTAQIEEARQMAEDAAKAKSLFLANMSHELRTPLNAVVGFSELLNEDDYTPEKNHIITSIKTAGKTLSTLINDLLDLSKLEAGKMTIKSTAVDLSRVLFEIRHIFNLRLKEKDIDFILDIDPSIPGELVLDETRFRQILINLTGNSIKFTDSGFIKISTKLLEINSNNTIDFKLSVIDTGCGIDEKEKERIFDLFWQSNSRDLNKPSGTGLGLSISRNLATLMNGTMNVDSEVSKGTTISIVFREMPIAIPTISGSAKKEDLPGQTSFEGVKAVIADDIDDNRNLLLEIMNQMNIKGIPAGNGKEAIEMVFKENPDIIFMDLQMPVMDGYAAASLLKENGETRTIPIVAVTASLETELFGSNGSKTNFFADYITKPYSVNSIRNVLAKFVSHKASSISDPFSGIKKIRSEDSIDDMENLLIKMEEFHNEWKGLKPSGRMSRLENFGERMRAVGKRHNARILTEYAESLLSSIKVFDLKAIEKELGRFPEIIRTFNQ